MTEEEVLKLFEQQWIDPETKEKVNLTYYFYMVRNLTENSVRMYKHRVDDVKNLVDDLSELEYDSKNSSGLLPRFYTKR